MGAKETFLLPKAGSATGKEIIEISRGQDSYQISVSDLPAFIAAGLAQLGTVTTGSVMQAGTTDKITLTGSGEASLWLSGSGSASGWAEYTSDDGATWGPSYVNSTQLDTFTYSASSQLVPLGPPAQAGTKMRINFQSVSGTVSWKVTQ